MPLEGLRTLSYTTYKDTRGSFAEIYNQRDIEDAGLNVKFVQDNLSVSTRANTLRGLHFQRKNPQAKLIGVVKGSIYDVCVDIRPSTKTFKHWMGFYLDSKNNTLLFVPEGFAHGFVTLVDNTEVLYKCSAFYDAKDEGGIRYDDPELGITWPVLKEISEKDSKLKFMKNIKFGKIK